MNRKKAVEKNSGILQQLETQIAVTDHRIDQLVCELYDLNEEPASEFLKRIQAARERDGRWKSGKPQ